MSTRSYEPRNETDPGNSPQVARPSSGCGRGPRVGSGGQLASPVVAAHHWSQAPKPSVEFGVQDYRESNTRFLIRQGDWQGVIIEADPADCERIRCLEESWRFDLRLVEAFVTRETINNLIAGAGLEGDIGLLS